MKIKLAVIAFAIGLNVDNKIVRDFCFDLGVFFASTAIGLGGMASGIPSGTSDVIEEIPGSISDVVDYYLESDS